jgi:NAD-dependent SIR2 family protein deacetylase
MFFSVAYRCTACGWKASVSDQHGHEGDHFHELYCRECGRYYRLRDFPYARGDDGEPLPAELNGVRLPAVPRGEVPMIRCSACGTTGPLGSAGPITDERPESCPRCKAGAIQCEGPPWLCEN